MELARVTTGVRGFQDRCILTGHRFHRFPRTWGTTGHVSHNIATWQSLKNKKRSVAVSYWLEFYSFNFENFQNMGCKSVRNYQKSARFCRQHPPPRLKSAPHLLARFFLFFFYGRAHFTFYRTGCGQQILPGGISHLFMIR
jgi:hypothetical protein